MVADSQMTVPETPSPDLHAAKIKRNRRHAAVYQPAPATRISSNPV